MSLARRVVVSVGTVMVTMATSVGMASATDTEDTRRPDTVLFAALDGAQEVPGPGDPDGSGTALLGVHPDSVCALLRVADIALPTTVAHVHRGARGVSGPVVVVLPNPANGSSVGCVPVEPALAREIAQRPGEFYVNVHNAEFPDGAVRGQLVPTEN